MLMKHFNIFIFVFGVFVKKTIIAAALLGTLGLVRMASAATSASQVFTWSGTVPAAPTFAIAPVCRSQ